MADITTGAGGLEEVLGSILSDFAHEVEDQSRRDVDAAAEVGLRKVEEGAARHVARRGKYAKSWKSTTVTGSLGSRSKVIHSTQPGLTHLLDKGHLLRDGSRYAGDGHIAAAGEAAMAELRRRMHG